MRKEKMFVKVGFVVLLMMVCFIFTGCVDYMGYLRKIKGPAAQDGKMAASEPDKKERKLNKRSKPGSVTSDKPSVDNPPEIVPDNIAVGVSIGTDEQMPFVDSYEEQIEQLKMKAEEIKMYKEQIKGLEKITAELTGSVSSLRDAMAEKETTLGVLREQNNKLTAQFAEKIRKLQDQLDVYSSSIKAVKVELVGAQIAEVKAKQELVRVRTQYLMDKKRWEDK